MGGISMFDEIWIYLVVLGVGLLLIADVILELLVCLYAWRTAKIAWYAVKIWWLTRSVRGKGLTVGIRLDFREGRVHTLDQDGQSAVWRGIAKLERFFSMVLVDTEGRSIALHRAKTSFDAILDVGSWDMEYAGSDYEQVLSFTVYCNSESYMGCVRIPITKWYPAWLANKQLEQELLLVMLYGALRAMKAQNQSTFVAK